MAYRNVSPCNLVKRTASVRSNHFEHDIILNCPSPAAGNFIPQFSFLPPGVLNHFRSTACSLIRCP